MYFRCRIDVISMPLWYYANNRIDIVKFKLNGVVAISIRCYIVVTSKWHRYDSWFDIVKTSNWYRKNLLKYQFWVVEVSNWHQINISKNLLNIDSASNWHQINIAKNLLKYRFCVAEASNWHCKNLLKYR